MTRLRCILLATLLAAPVAGCNAVFDIRETRPVDAAIVVLIDASDIDHDEVADVDDNCPAAANADQLDGDGDLAGDACDSCPLTANAQSEDSDADGLGDACDPHPNTSGDCLVLFDTFRDPTQFSAGWDIFTTNTTPNVEPRAGDVVLHYQAGFNLGILAKNVAGFVNVEVQSTSATGQAVVVAVAATSTSLAGYQCNLQQSTNNVVVNGPSCTTTFKNVIPPVSGARNSSVRLYLDDTGSGVTTSCRADLGFSVGTASSTSCTRNDTGAPGVLAAGEDVTVHAITFIRWQPGETCTTVRR
jgi:hypothetical protein